MSRPRWTPIQVPAADELQGLGDDGPVVDVRDSHFQLPIRPRPARPDGNSQDEGINQTCHLGGFKGATTDDSDGASSDVVFTPEGSASEDDDTGKGKNKDQVIEKNWPSNPGEPKDFYEAITRGDIEAVNVHLSKGARVDRKTHNGYTPLVVAIVECQLEMAKFLLENYASVHQRVNKLAPIVYATKKSILTKQFIQLLLDYGAFPSIPSGPYYYNALHSATINGNIDAVDLLICRGMNTEGTCDRGRSALHVAAESGDTMIAKLLLAKGANINHRSHHGNTALVEAALEGHMETIRFLLKEGLGVDDGNNYMEITPLWISSSRGHLEVVKLLLQNGANINSLTSEPEGYTPAMAAAITGRFDVLNTLIGNGAELTIVNGDGNTALALALTAKRRNVVGVLLKAMGGLEYPQESLALEIAMARTHKDLISIMNVTGLFQPNRGSSDGSIREMLYGEVVEQILRQGGTLLRSHTLSTLMAAALHEADMAMVVALLKNGCSPNEFLAPGQTPLQIAIARQHLELVDVLLHWGADPAMLSTVGPRYTPLHLALVIFDSAVVKDTSIIDLLLESRVCKLMKGEDMHSTAFSFVLDHFGAWPCKLGEILTFRMLESIEDIHGDRSDDGSTLLHAAVRHGRTDIVELLRSRGADIDAVDHAGCTPFYMECKRGTQLLTFLWMRHADERCKGPGGQSTLHMAVSGGKLEVIDFLLDLDLDIDGVDDNGYTPLAWALILGQEDAALHLLSRGATVPTNKFRRGRKLLHTASSLGMLRIIKRVLAGMFNDVDARDDMGWTPLGLACRKGSPELVSALLDAHANFEASPNNTLDRPLHLALRAGNVDVARVLVSRGADVTIKGEKGQTPLHLVAQLGDVKLFQMLIDDGCDVQALDDSGRTALSLCSGLDIASLLITHGCFPNHEDTHGWTPAHYAVTNGNLSVLRVLLLNGADVHVRTKDDGISVIERIEDVVDDEVKRGMEQATGKYGVVFV